MVSLRESIESSMIDIDYNEFYASINVCDSLYKNYLKIYEMSIRNKEMDTHVMCEHFIMENESWWRKDKEDGTKEHILISILLIPLRAIQALIKLMKRFIERHRNKTLDKKIDVIIHDENLKDISSESSAEMKDDGNSSSLSSKKEKKVNCKIKIDKSGEKSIETNVDLDQSVQASDDVIDYIDEQNQRFAEIARDADMITKMITDGLKSGKMTHKNAQDIINLMYWRPGMKHDYELGGFKDKKNEALDKIPEVNKICEQYEKTLERLINAIRKSGKDDQVTKDVLKQLTDLQSENNKVVVATADMMQYLEGVIKVCETVCDDILEKSDNIKPEGDSK